MIAPLSMSTYLCPAFPRRAGVDRQRMYAGGEFARKYLVNHAMALDPALTAERLRYDMNPEMRLPARPMAGMANVLVRFVHHIEALRRESRGQFVRNETLYLHGSYPRSRSAMAARSTVDDGKSSLSRLEGVFTNSA